jgi:large subunit ribosomal protein L31
MAKEGIHPNYRDVLFVDLSNGFKFVTRSCVNTKEMGKTDDGKELPMFKLDTSSESHPFYTGTQKSVNDMAGSTSSSRSSASPPPPRPKSPPRPMQQPKKQLPNKQSAFDQGQPGQPRCPFSLPTHTRPIILPQ